MSKFQKHLKIIFHFLLITQSINQSKKCFWNASPEVKKIIHETTFFRKIRMGSEDGDDQENYPDGESLEN